MAALPGLWPGVLTRAGPGASCTLWVRGDQRVTGMRRDGREAAVPSCFKGEERSWSWEIRGYHTHVTPGLERSSPCSITGGTMP